MVELGFFTGLGRDMCFTELGRDRFLTWMVRPWYLIGLIRVGFCTGLGQAKFQSGISGPTGVHAGVVGLCVLYLYGEGIVGLKGCDG